MSQRAGPGNSKKRGHQHHPRNDSNRRRAALELSANAPLSPYSVANVATKQQQELSNQKQKRSASNSIQTEAPKCDKNVIDLTNTNDDDDDDDENIVVVETINSNKKNLKDEHNLKIMAEVFRPAAEGSSQSDIEEFEDPEIEELSKLRCTSERTEVVAERETRRRGRRCADYPGLAFASSIFSSDTLMKFSIIRNELHNIMSTQLKRVGSNTNNKFNQP